ncbi:MAG: CapA family protein [Planctomycetota bacterium]
MVKIGLWGDISFGLGVQPLAGKYGYDYFFDEVRETLGKSNANIANFDCTITESEDKNKFRDGSHLKTKAEAAKAMWEAKFKLATLANNHIWDYGVQGISDTLKAFEEYSMLTAGVGRTLEEAIRPAVLDIKGVRIAIISCTALAIDTNSLKKYIIASLKPELIKQMMKQHRNEVDHFLISIHWGREFVNYPFVRQVHTARQLIDAGASAVVGHHSHVIGPVEEYGDGFVAYALGDFVFDQTDNADIPGRNHSLGIILELDRDRLLRSEIIPLTLDKHFRPCNAVPDNREEILCQVSRLSADLKDLGSLDKKTRAQASHGFVGRQWSSLTKTYKHGGIYSILLKLRRLRLLHITIFASWLRQKVRGK